MPARAVADPANARAAALGPPESGGAYQIRGDAPRVPGRRRAGRRAAATRRNLWSSIL